MSPAPQSMPVVQQLPQAKPELLGLVGTGQALDLGDHKAAVGLVPGEVVVGSVLAGLAGWLQGQQAGLSDRFCQRISGGGVPSPASVDRVQVALEQHMAGAAGQLVVGQVGFTQRPAAPGRRAGPWGA